MLVSSAACRSDDRAGSPTTTSPPSTTTTTPLVAHLAPLPEPPAVASDAVALPARAIASATAAWRGWARAVASGQIDRAGALSRDAANSWTVVIGTVHEADALAGHPHTIVARGRPGRVVAASDDEVVLDASLAVVDRHAGETTRAHLTRPLLRRFDDGWHLTSFVINGTALGWANPDRAARDRGTELRLLTLLTTSAGTWVITRVAPPDPGATVDPLRSEIASPSRSSPLVRAYVSSGGRPVVIWRFPSTDDVARLDLHLEVDGERTAFSF